MKDWLADVTKWIVVIAVAAIAFYLVYPKYYFMKVGREQEQYLRRGQDVVGVIRYNTITGKSRHFLQSIEGYTLVSGKHGEER